MMKGTSDTGNYLYNTFRIMNMSRPDSINSGYFKEQANLFKALAHPVRLQILDVVREGEACVCHLEAIVAKRQSYISQQVSVLKKAGLLAERREGQFIFYSLANSDFAAVIDAGRALLQRPGEQVSKAADPWLPGYQSVVSDCVCPRCSPEEEMAVEHTR